MKAIDVILEVAKNLKLESELLELEKVKADIQNETYTHPLNAQTIDFENLSAVQKEIYFLMKYLNNAVEYVATSFIPLKDIQAVQSDDSCRILFSSITHPVYNVINVKHENCKCSFSNFPTFLKVGKANEEYLVCYMYYPNCVSGLNDDIEIDARVSANILSDKIASEYLFNKTMYDESVYYEKKFLSNMQYLCVGVKEKKLPHLPLY